MIPAKLFSLDLKTTRQLCEFDNSTSGKPQSAASRKVWKKSRIGALNLLAAPGKRHRDRYQVDGLLDYTSLALVSFRRCFSLSCFLPSFAPGFGCTAWFEQQEQFDLRSNTERAYVRRTEIVRMRIVGMASVDSKAPGGFETQDMRCAARSQRRACRAYNTHVWLHGMGPSSCDPLRHFLLLGHTEVIRTTGSLMVTATP